MVTDPAGLIARIPELEALAEDAGVRRAIERGDVHGLYRVLFWAHLLGRMRSHRDTIKQLLERRRLFLKPITSAPALFTYNGVGLTVYGNAEHNPNDGTYIATHYLVLLYLPVLPLRQYLVIDAQGTGGRRAWSFVGKVPFSPVAFIWNRLLRLLVVASLVLAGASAFKASRYHPVHFVNATSVRVQAEASGRRVTVEPGGNETLTLHVGRQQVAVSRGDGTPIESQEIDVHSGSEVEVFNVLGAALVYRETVRYHAEGSPKAGAPPEAAMSCGEAFARYDETDDVFVAPPQELSTSSSASSVHRTHLGFVPDGDACLNYLVEHGDVARAAAIARHAAEAGDYALKLTGQATALTERADGADAAMAFVQKALAARPDDVDTHRIYQSLAIANGKRAELVLAYQKLRDQKPADPDRAYLLARLEPPSRASAVMGDLVQRFPKHVASRRACAFDQYQTRHFAEALASWKALFELDPGERSDHREMEVRALVALGRGTEALAEIESAFSAAKTDRAELAELYARVAHAAGGHHDPEALFAKLNEDEGSPAMVSWHRARAGLPSKDEAATTPQGELLRQARAIIVAARSDPDGALTLCGQAPAPALGALDEDTWAVLFAESARREPSGKTTEALASAGFRTGDEIRAMRAFVATGEASVDLEEASFELRAAAALARSRNPSLPAPEHKRLAASARHDDLLHGLITAALDGWKSARN
jgi:tetratricopeptide (TPR) repeat protein